MATVLVPERPQPATWITSRGVPLSSPVFDERARADRPLVVLRHLPTFAFVALLLALAACRLPSRRATRISPLAALHTE